MLRAASDRVIAGLAAVAAVIIGNITAVIPAEVTTGLLTVVSGFFLLLTALALIVDGPVLSTSTKYLGESVDIAASLLTPSQRDSIVNSQSVSAARGRVRTVRIVLPIVYGLVALAVMIYALSRP